jgi:serine/threonine protein kinase
MMMQLCSAVRYLHACGFVHGDISSANVLVASTLRIKVRS